MTVETRLRSRTQPSQHTAGRRVFAGLGATLLVAVLLEHSPLVKRVSQAEEPVIQAPAFDESVEEPGDLVQSEFLIQEIMLSFEERNYQQTLDLLDQLPSEPPSMRYYRGLSLLRLKRAEEATAVLTELRQRPDAPDEVRLDSAIALIQNGSFAEAEQELQNLVAEQPEDPHARFFYGVALHQQGEVTEAQEQMNEAVNVDQGLAPYRDAYRNYDQRLGAAAPGVYTPAPGPHGTPRNWNLSLLTGYEYDSNVPQSPNFSGLGSGFQRADSRWVTGMFGDYRLIQEEDQVLGVFGSAYGNFQFELDRFNTQNYSGGAYFSQAFGDWILGANYSYNDTLLNNTRFAGSHRLTTSATYRWDQIGHTTGFYEYENLNLRGLALIPAQNRSGTTNSVGLTQAYYIGPQNLGRLFFGYRFGDTSASGSDFDMQSHMINARVEYPIFADLVYDAEVRHFWDDYSNANSLDFFGRARSDTRLQVRTGLQKYVTEHASIRLDYTYVNSNSNVRNLFDVGFYTYDRHMLSTLFIYDF